MANLNSSSLLALNDDVTASPLENFGTAGIIISGTWTGTITFEGSMDGTTFVAILAQELGTHNLITSTTVNSQFLINTSGMGAIRARMSAFTSGQADIVIQANAATFLQRSLSTVVGDTDGTFIGNVGDRFKVDAFTTADNVLDFWLEVSKGNVPGHTANTIAGFNPDVKTTEEDVWGFGGIYQFPTSASILDLVSTSANDTAAGTGARTVAIIELDINYVEQTEIVTLNGLTPVSTVNTYLRLNVAAIDSAGSLEINEGNINITHNISGFILGKIEADFGKTLNAVFTVPDGKTLFAVNVALGGSGGQSAIFKFFIRQENKPFIVINTAEVEATPFENRLIVPRALPEHTDLRVSVSTQTGSSSISVSLQAILVDN